MYRFKLICFLFVCFVSIAFADSWRDSKLAHRANNAKYQRFHDPTHQGPLGAIMMLLSDWKETRGRTCYFNASMDALSEHWRPHNKYPIILMNTVPWRWKDMAAIRRTWKLLDFRFINIGSAFNVNPSVPLHQLEDANKPLSNLAYKRMCQFFFHGFTQVPMLMQYKYLLRMDDDTCIQDNINFDMFQLMEEHSAAYAYSSIWFDGMFVTRGMYDHAEEYLEVHNLTWSNPKLLERTKHESNFPNAVPAFNTNLEIVNTARHTTPRVMSYLTAVVKSDMIFYRRWGDAPLRYLLALLFWTDKDIMRLDTFDHQHSTWPAARMRETLLTPSVQF